MTKDNPKVGKASGHKHLSKVVGVIRTKDNISKGVQPNNVFLEDSESPK